MDEETKKDKTVIELFNYSLKPPTFVNSTSE